MDHRIHIGPRPIAPGAHPQPAHSQKPAASAETTFQQVLGDALSQPVRVSGHAQERLAASRRTLSETEMKTISQAVDRAAQKGARDALILMRDLALVVSVKNRTVITAVGGERIKENIFTNIDSAVIL